MPYSKEQARLLLEDPSVLELTAFADHLRAIANETLPQYYLGRFIYRRDYYKDELPLENVQLLIQEEEFTWLQTRQGPRPRSTQYKCQTTFVIGFVNELRNAITDGVITNEALINEINVRFGNGAQPFEFSIGDPENTPKMAIINDLLQRAIDNVTSVMPQDQRPQA
jgi:hypothetical protein